MKFEDLSFCGRPSLDGLLKNLHQLMACRLRTGSEDIRVRNSLFGQILLRSELPFMSGRRTAVSLPMERKGIGGGRCGFSCAKYKQL